MKRNQSQWTQFDSICKLMQHVSHKCSVANKMFRNLKMKLILFLTAHTSTYSVRVNATKWTGRELETLQHSGTFRTCSSRGTSLGDIEHSGLDVDNRIGKIVLKTLEIYKDIRHCNIYLYFIHLLDIHPHFMYQQLIYTLYKFS